MNDRPSDNTTPPPPPASAPPPARGKPRRDRAIKLGFLAVALLVVGWLVYRQYFGVDPAGFRTDFEAALADAQKEGRSLLVLVHDRPPADDFERLKRILIQPANDRAMTNANVIRVSVYFDRGGSWWKKYRIKIYPTLLLLGPDGGKTASHPGYMAETALPPFVYQAVRLKDWHTDLAAAKAEAAGNDKNLLVLLYDEPDDYTFGVLKVDLNRPDLAEAIDAAGVAKAAFLWDPKGPLKESIKPKTPFPVLLLLRSNGNEITRRDGVAIEKVIGKDDFEADFWEKFLKGEKAD